MTALPDEGNIDDQRVMSTFHYKQELRRTIRLFGSFAVAFSFISITTGIFVNYELVLDRSGPAGIWTWPIVIVGQLFVALVFAELSARMPLTGYSYQWVTRLGGSGWGWFTRRLSFHLPPRRRQSSDRRRCLREPTGFARRCAIYRGALPLPHERTPDQWGTSISTSHFQDAILALVLAVESITHSLR